MRVQLRWAITQKRSLNNSLSMFRDLFRFLLSLICFFCWCTESTGGGVASLTQCDRLLFFLRLNSFYSEQNSKRNCWSGWVGLRMLRLLVAPSHSTDPGFDQTQASDFACLFTRKNRHARFIIAIEQSTIDYSLLIATAYLTQPVCE